MKQQLRITITPCFEKDFGEFENQTDTEERMETMEALKELTKDKEFMKYYNLSNETKEADIFKDGYKYGKTKNTLDNAINLHKLGISNDIISRALNIDFDELQENLK